ncbi:MAG: hypothetical protein H6731_02970 [Myxococcales bacterium]|nr:MAG: hypothetical protein H6731_02970 [Myxococcales bacterium]
MFKKNILIFFLFPVNCFSFSIFDIVTYDLDGDEAQQICLEINGSKCSHNNEKFVCDEEQFEFSIAEVEKRSGHNVAICFKWSDENSATLSSSLKFFPFKTKNCQLQFERNKTFKEQIKDELPSIEAKQKIIWNHEQEQINDQWVPKLKIYRTMFLKIMGFESIFDKKSNQTVLVFLIGLENTKREYWAQQEAYRFNHQCLSKKRIKGASYCDLNLKLHPLYLATYAESDEYARWAEINGVFLDKQEYAQYEVDSSKMAGQLLYEKGQEFGGCCYMFKKKSSPINAKNAFILVSQKEGEQVFYQGQKKEGNFLCLDNLPVPELFKESQADGQELVCFLIKPTKIKFCAPDSGQKHTKIEFCSDMFYQLKAFHNDGAYQEWQEVVDGGDGHRVEFVTPEFIDHKAFSQADVSKSLVQLGADGVAQALKSFSIFFDENKKKKIILNLKSLKNSDEKRLASQEFLRLFDILGPNDLSYHIEDDFMPKYLDQNDLLFLSASRAEGNFNTLKLDLEFGKAEIVFNYLKGVGNLDIDELTLPPINNQNHLAILKEFLTKNQVRSLKVSIKPLFDPRLSKPENEKDYYDFILEVSNNNLEELFLPDGIDVSFLEILFTNRNLIFGLGRDAQSKLSQFLAKIKTPVVLFESMKSSGGFFDGIVSMLQKSQEIMTELRISNKKLSTEQKKSMIACVSGMNNLKIFKLHLTNLNNREVFFLAKSLADKIKLKNLFFDMPAPESFGISKARVITYLTWNRVHQVTDSLLMKIFLQTTIVPLFSLAGFSKDVYYVVARNFDEFVPQGYSFDMAIEKLYELSHLPDNSLEEIVLYTENNLNKETAKLYKTPTQEILNIPELMLDKNSKGFKDPNIVFFKN